MKIGEAFPSNYIKAHDLQGADVPVVISHVQTEDVGGEQLPVIYFDNKTKGLVLNKTNATTIVEILGTDETTQWSGKRIVLFPTQTDYQGRQVSCIRVRMMRTQTTMTPAGGEVHQEEQQAPIKEPAPDDDIPF